MSEVRTDKETLEDVSAILNSGNSQIIHTMKTNLKAYLVCIDVHNKHTKSKDELEKMKLKLSYTKVEAQKKRLTYKDGKAIEGLKIISGRKEAKS